METIIKGIRIIHNENQKEKIESIRKIINNNYELLSEVLERVYGIDITEDEDLFDSLFYKIVEQTYKNGLCQEKFNGDTVLVSLYIKAICLVHNIKPDDFDNDDLLSKEDLSEMIAYKYFQDNGTFNDFVEYLKVKDREKELSEWFADRARWETLEMLYSSILEAIKYGEDDNIIQFMKDITAIWLTRACEKVRDMPEIILNNNVLTDTEFENLFYEFMKYINAPIEWTNTFNYLKENNLIVIEKSIDESTRGKCFLDNDGKFKIKLSNMNTIDGFSTFIHEFIHYITMSKELLLHKVLLLEFPSIFYERIVDEFLLEKGLIKEEQSSIERELNNYILCMSCATKYREFFQYVETGKVNKEERIAECKARIKVLSGLKEKEVGIHNLDVVELIENTTAEEMVNTECDMTIENSLKNRLYLIEGQEYLVATSIVEGILDKRKEDESVMDKMIEITNNLKDFNVKSILNMFGLETSIEYEAKQIAKKYYKEKKNEETK